MESPILVWQPGDERPDFGEAAYRLQVRWIGRVVRRVAAYIATARTAQLFGGKALAVLKHLTQATHDLGVAAIWIRLHRHNPALAQAWCGEDLLAHTRLGEKLPDAFVVNDGQVPVAVIEFGSSYDAARVQAFHDDCADRELPYQIW